nr:immunoglobulin heavy chain junction region [Macaca mulatta]MOY24214.1 immunoglobulin heavy chain junction region [Macaca mulatta]MOY25846.1 immunoglobulin heavy chain junction region [Macaca mulatta]MOY27458.1 immunoglobulin heavy chain junction region [Macaca mulatta]MOY29324.1 immunoglobulin heavy chain junction region [Macaca mulatta]
CAKVTYASSLYW